MRYIFLGTNNWIYLSNGFNILNNKHDELHFKVFDLIKKRVNDGSLTVLTNRLILEEWARNKQHCKNQIKELKDRQHAYLSTLKNIKKVVDDVGKKLSEALESKIQRHESHINDVEEFLMTKTTQIDIPDHIKVKAADLATEKKAPFIGDKKNSMADALILLSSIEHIEKFCGVKLFGGDSKTVVYPENYFVSGNSGDFSSPTNKEIIHPDFRKLSSENRNQILLLSVKAYRIH